MAGFAGLGIGVGRVELAAFRAGSLAGGEFLVDAFAPFGGVFGGVAFATVRTGPGHLDHTFLGIVWGPVASV